MREAAPSTKPGAYFLAALVLLSFSTILSAQVIENPAKPKAANAGRIVVPQEVLAISEEGTSDFYFKRPRGLHVAPDGSLVLMDDTQILLFDKNGKFRHNFFKKGQGPGEVTYVGACLATDKNVIVHSTYPNKLIFFDYSGKYEREILVGSLPGSGRTQARILLVHGGDYLLQARDFPQPKGGDPHFVDIPQMVLSLNDKTGEPKTLTTFMTKAFAVAAPGGGGGSYDITDLIAVPFKEVFLALTHTEEYLLKIFDPVGNKIIREFRRTYKRIKPEPLTEEQKRGGVLIGNKPFGPPELEYQNDVKNILARGDDIWAVTSTKDKAKGVLIDLFDGAGVYRDCFWLKLPEAALKSVLSPGSCALDGDSLWVVERSEDETFAIKKYRVVI